MKKRLIALLCALLLPLSACAPAEEPPPEGAYRVYFAVTGEEGAARAVDFEYHSLDPAADQAAGLVDLLLAGPAETGLGSPLPAAGVHLRALTLEEGGRLHLDLSEQYNGLPGVYLTVANACFALTLDQAPGVESLYITVEGEPLPYQTVQSLREEDFILTGAEEAAVTVSALLYFPRKDGSGLGGEYRDVVKTEADSLPAAVLAALGAGPQYEGLSGALPQGTEVRSVKVENGLCRVDLSAAFLDDAPPLAGDARLALYALVNTLCALDEVSIDSVQLLVEGQPIPLYGGVPLLTPLEPNFDLAN